MTLNYYVSPHDYLLQPLFLFNVAVSHISLYGRRVNYLAETRELSVSISPSAMYRNRDIKVEWRLHFVAPFTKFFSF